MRTPDLLSRRRLLRHLALGLSLGSLAVIGSRHARAAAALPLLQEDSPEAKGVRYVADAARAKGASGGNTCATCGLYQGATGSTQGPCQLFAGKDVKAAAGAARGSRRCSARSLVAGTDLAHFDRGPLRRRALAGQRQRLCRVAQSSRKKPPIELLGLGERPVDELRAARRACSAAPPRRLSELLAEQHPARLRSADSRACADRPPRPSSVRALAALARGSTINSMYGMASFSPVRTTFVPLTPAGCGALGSRRCSRAFLRERGRALEFRARLVVAAELGQQVAAHARQQVVAPRARPLRASASASASPAAGP